MDVLTDSYMSQATGVGPQGGGPMFGPSQAGKSKTDIVDRRHPEWRTHQLRWRFLLDSWEGGETYRQSIYGWDLTGLPVRNLIRHPHEYPNSREQNYYGVLGRPPGSDQYAQATNDPYELRRARQPVPTLLRRTVCKHLSKIFHEDSERQGPDEVVAWWKDVNGSSTAIRDFMKDTVAPLGLIFGHLDVIADFPPPPKGVERADIRTNADARKHGLDRVVCSYILPENVVWWSLDGMGRYEEVLICEPQEAKGPQYRYWTPEEWVLFDFQQEVLDRANHPFGRPPIVGLFDKRRPRAKNVGLPRYEDIAEIAREVYNRSSELILSDTHQAHAIIQAAEDFCQANAAIPLGPNNVLPKKKTVSGNTISYEPWEVLEFPKAGAEQLRTNLLDLFDQADQCGHMTRPAGAAASNGKTVAQSGTSKRMDSEDGNTVLGDISETMARWDRELAMLYLFVAGRGRIDGAAAAQVRVRYPKDFDLFSPDETAGLIGDYQQSLQGTGATPTADHEMMTRLYRSFLKGLPDEQYAAIDDEIEQAIAKRSKLHAARHEATLTQTEAFGEDVEGTASSPDSTNSASLASAGVLVTEVY